MSAVVCTKCGSLTVAQCQCVQMVGIVPGNIYDQQLPENIIAELQAENARLRVALAEAKAQVKKDIVALLDRYEIIDGKIRAEIEAL